MSATPTVRRGREELRFGQFGEDAALCHQLVEAAALHDAAAVEHEDARGVAHRGEPVGDDEGGAALHHLVEGGGHLGLGRGIERARRLVEDQDRRVLQQRPGDRQPLPLAAREHAPALADDRVQPVAVPLDEFERLGALQAASDLLVGGVWIADAQILGDRAVEQQRLLKDHPDIAPEARELHARGCRGRRCVIFPDCGS